MAVTLTGTGVFTNNVRALQRLIASSDRFQQLCGVSTEAAAMAFVYTPEASDRDDAAAPRPRAIILPPQATRTKRGNGTWANQGTTPLSLEFDTPSELRYFPEAACAWVLDQIDQIILEMEANSEDGSGNYLNVTGWRNFEGPAEGIPDNENQEQFWGVSFEVDWC